MKIVILLFTISKSNTCKKLSYEQKSTLKDTNLIAMQRLVSDTLNYSRIMTEL